MLRLTLPALVALIGLAVAGCGGAVSSAAGSPATAIPTAAAGTSEGQPVADGSATGGSSTTAAPSAASVSRQFAATPSASVPASPAPAGQPAAAGPDSPDALIVTPDDNGKTISLAVGQTFLLKLGDGIWSPTVDDQSVVSRIPNIAVVRGAQGIYRAHHPGTARMTASDGTTSFHLTIVVR